MGKRSKKKQSQLKDRGLLCYPLILYKKNEGTNILREDIKYTVENDPYFKRMNLNIDYLEITADSMFVSCFEHINREKHLPASIDIVQNILLRAMSVNPVEFREVFGEEDKWSVCRDLMSNIAIVEKWGEHKQIYKVDKDFATELSDTETLRLYPHLLRRLPYECFYIDLEGDEDYSPTNGAFVWIKVGDDNTVAIIVTRIIEEVLFPFYWELREDHGNVYSTCRDNGVAYFDIPRENIIQKMPDTLYSSKYMRDNGEDYRMSNKNFDRLMLTILQLATYLSSKEPDVVRSAINKAPSTDKQSRRIPEYWDIGVRYGNTIRISMNESKDSNERVNTTNVTGKTHRSPKPHSRSAHWQHYWTGKGRTTLELRWKSPIFVGAKSDSVATYHKVTN